MVAWSRRIEIRAIAARPDRVIGLAAAAWVWQPWRADPPLRARSGAFVPSGPQRRALVWALGDGAGGSVRAQRVVTRMRRKRFDRVL